MIAYVTEICASCGNLRSVCSDPNVPLYPQRRMCYASGVRDLTVRRLRAKHKDEPGLGELHALDGLSVWVSPEDLSPDDNFV